MPQTARADSMPETDLTMIGTPEATPRDASRSALKLNLATMRQEKGLSLDEICRSTYIAVHFLEAIEKEDFANLPGGVYSTSYIRQYAQAIGCDASMLLERYCLQMAPKPQATAATSPPEFARLRWRLPRVLRSLLGHVTPHSGSQPTA